MEDITKTKKETKTKKFHIDWKEVFSILGLFTAWRSIIWLIAFIGKGRFDFGKDQSYGWVANSTQDWVGELPTWLQYWARWDSGWYIGIADKGYFWNSPGEWSNVVFFPLYPQIIRLFSLLVDNNLMIGGIIASSVITLVTCFYFYRLVKFELDKKTALRAVLYLLIFPTSIFLASVYTEPLFILTCVASLYHARQKQWYGASIWGLLATLTRPSGIIILGVLLFEYFEQRNFNPMKVRLSVLNLTLVPAGLGLYMYFLFQRFGNPFIFLFAQDAWGRNTSMSLMNAWNTVVSHFHDLISFDTENLAYYLANAFDFLFFAIFFILAILVFFFLRKSYGLFMLAYLMIPALTGTFISMGRFALVLFPAFILLAKWGKNQTLNYSITILFSMLSALFITMFVNTYWIG